MDIVKLDLKVFADPRTEITGRDLVPVFHRWIQQSRLDEQLIDVADYSHVHQGPAAILVGHQAHYTYDLAAGRPGLLVSRRRDGRPAGDTGGRLRSLLRTALTACRELESDAALAGRLRFLGGELMVRVNDRLALDDAEQVTAQLRHHLQSLIVDLYADAPVTVERHDGGLDGRLELSISTAAAPDVATLLQRLDAGDRYLAAAANGHLAGSGAAR